MTQDRTDRTLAIGQGLPRGGAVLCRGGPSHQEGSKALTFLQEWGITSKVDLNLTTIRLQSTNSSRNYRGQLAKQASEVSTHGALALGTSHLMPGRRIRRFQGETLRMTFSGATGARKNSEFLKTNKAKAPSAKLVKELTSLIGSSSANLRNKSSSNRRSNTQSVCVRCLKRVTTTVKPVH